MAKIRVNEIAKEINQNYKVVLTWCKDRKLNIRSHSSTVDWSVANEIRRHFGCAPIDEPQEEVKPKKQRPPRKPKEKLSAPGPAETVEMTGAAANLELEESSTAPSELAMQSEEDEDGSGLAQEENEEPADFIEVLESPAESPEAPAEPEPDLAVAEAEEPECPVDLPRDHEPVETDEPERQEFAGAKQEFAGAKQEFAGAKPEPPPEAPDRVRAQAAAPPAALASQVPVPAAPPRPTPQPVVPVERKDRVKAKILGRAKIHRSHIEPAPAQGFAAPHVPPIDPFGSPPPAAPSSKGEKRRKEGVEKFTFRREPELGPRRRQRIKGRAGKAEKPAPVIERPEHLVVQLPVTLKDLSSVMCIKGNLLIAELMKSGHMAKINDYLAEEAILELAVAFGIDIEIRARDAEAELRELVAQEMPTETLLADRAPVVTVLGHVDHGKTSLLDFIRKTRVAAGESGGITQHVGTSEVQVGNKRIVFLDTPGHEAFSAMRARGAELTDIVVLVVAADDGVMPQTIEAIAHAKAAEVPIIVALNKIDKPNANPQKVLQQLAGQGVQSEAWGGDVLVAETSAITGLGVDTLLENILLQAEVLELKADPTEAARGTVVEAHVSEGKGVVATVLVQSGTLRVGDNVICGPGVAKVRALHTDSGGRVREAGPSTAVEVAGLSEVPTAGDKLYVVADLEKARGIADMRRRLVREEGLAERQKSHVTLENLFSQIEADNTKELRLLLKADVQGSIEVMKDSCEKLSGEEVRIVVLHAAVGAVSTSDVHLADASDAIILSFRVATEEKARALAKAQGVEVRTYQVIYKLRDELHLAIEGMLDPEEQEEVTGHVEIRRVFTSSKLGRIAGCYVTDGVIHRQDRLRLMRDGIVIHDGAIGSLRREKDDAKEVREGFECGIKIDGYDDIKEGDVIESFAIRQVARTLA